MRKIQSIFIILVLPLIISSQCSTAIKHAAIRTVSAPIHLVKSIYSAVTPNKYKKLIKEENELQLSNSPKDSTCNTTPESKVDGLSNAAVDIDKVLCKHCVPWARVSSPAPYCAPTCAGACEKVCPQKGFGILNEYKKKLIPNDDNKFHFRNSSAMFKDADSALIPFQGYCSGMVSSRRKFNMNAFFEPTSLPKDSRGNVLKRGDPKLISYYKKIVDKIHNNYPTEIPGYKNLGEFSRDPMIQDIMRKSIANEWADVTVMRSTANATAMYDPALNRESMTSEQGDKLIGEIEEKLNHVGSATFYMGFGGAFNMHIVDATNIIKSKDKKSMIKATVCINDPNYSGLQRTGHSRSFKNGELSSCSPCIDIYKDGYMSYEGQEIKQARVDHKQDEAAVTTAVKRLRKYCKNKKSPPCQS
jgi:hypothetical protein